jgi:hypothetical protein
LSPSLGDPGDDARRRNALHMSTIRCRTLDQFEQARVFLIEEGTPHGSFPVQPG